MIEKVLLFYISIAINLVMFDMLSVFFVLRGDGTICRKAPCSSFLKMVLDAF